MSRRVRHVNARRNERVIIHLNKKKRKPRKKKTYRTSKGNKFDWATLASLIYGGAIIFGLSMLVKFLQAVGPMLILVLLYILIMWLVTSGDS